MLAIVYDPSMNELFVCEKGKGITLNGEKIIPETNQKNIFINLEWFGAEGFDGAIEGLKKKGIRARIAGSGVLAITYGAIGRGDGSVVLQNKPWDVAPGLIFSKELGLRVEQLDGKKVDLSKNQISMISASNKLFFRIKSAITE